MMFFCNVMFSGYLYRVRFIFPTFTLCSTFIVCQPVRRALTFVGCDKSKQKHAFAELVLRAIITAVPLLFIFLCAPFLLTVVETFTNYFIGNFRIATLCFLTARQRTTQIQFMFFAMSPLEIQLPLHFLSRTRFLTNLQ